ncbi:lipoprotein [Streptomyces sp. MMG1533]|nr:lipoprotein [Streptomyces sp. MMG1533]
MLASAAGAVLLVGCSAGSEDSDGGTGGSPSVVERARARAAGESTDLVARYDAVIAVHPALAERLGPLRAEAVRHAEAFGGVGKASPSVSPSMSPSVSASPPSASAAPSPAVPANEQDALAGLAAAERTLADRRAKALLDLPGEPARLLASVAAAGAAHAYLLTEGAK